jgi:hypothetical protein
VAPPVLLAKSQSAKTEWVKPNRELRALAVRSTAELAVLGVALAYRLLLALAVDTSA